MSILSIEYKKGLKEEKTVIKFEVEQLGKTFRDSTEHEDRLLDIDCYLDGISVSVKAMHSGAAYKNIYMELAQQLTAFKDCPLSAEIIYKKDLNQTDIDALIATGGWESSWYQNGQAQEYHILQGEILKVYKKQDIQDHVAKHGWLRCRPLSFKRSSYLGGKYRYSNAICGYLDISAIRHSSYHIPCDLPDSLDISS